MRLKPKLTLDVDSALALMQEIYNDVAEQKSNANLIMKKMLVFMKDSEDMSMIGPVIKEQQKILALCTDKKISLVKLQSLLLKQKQGDKTPGQSTEKFTFTEEDMELLKGYMDDPKNNETESYKM
jgi:hypothetical protein